MYVLVVENEAPLMTQMRAVLEDSAVSIVFAESREDALRIVHKAGAPGVLVTNVDLGQRLSGFSLAHDIRRTSPTMPTLFVSATRWDVVRGIVSPQDYFMQKPFDAAVFAEKLHHITKQILAPAAQVKRA